MKEFNKQFLDYIKERFTRYETYYQILRIKKEGISDEKVKQAYDLQMNQLEGMFKDNSQPDIIELKNMIKQTLDDAYTALKTQESRKNYDELLENIKGAER